MQIEDTNQHGFILKRSRQFKTKCVFCQDSRTKHPHDEPVSIDLDLNLFNCHHCGAAGQVNKERFERKEKKEYVLPPKFNHTALSDNLIKWFEGRGISQRTLMEMKITEGMEFMPQEGKEMNTVQFNYFRDGELINTKFRDGKKHFKMVKDAELIFYNIDGIKDTDEAIITEGEIDCLSFIEEGYKNCVSVPNGANLKRNNLDYLDNCISYFDNKKKIYIATDNDEAGLQLRKELARRLGIERCRRIDFKDCKDANEYKVKYNWLETVLFDAREFPYEGIFTIDDINAEIESLYNNGLSKGSITGHGALDELITWQTGRICIVTGIPSHGKSEATDDIISRLNYLYGWRVSLFSPENRPLQIHFAKIAEKFIGKPFSGENRMTKDELKQAKNYINDNFYFILPKDEGFTIDNILEKAGWLVKTKGIKILVIDPWNKIEHQQPGGISETNYISQQMDKIINFSMNNDILTFVIVHPTKMKKKERGNMYEVPTLYDCSGSANFYNKTDYGLSVYRYFEENRLEIYVQKVKFRHLGQTGIYNCLYNINNGRLTDLFVDNPKWDNSNYLDETISQKI